MPKGKPIYFLMRHLFTVYAIVGLGFDIAIHLFQIQYDDGGVAALVYWIGQAFCFLFWIFGESLFMLNSGESVPFHNVISIVCGLAAAYFLDRWLLHKPQ